MLTKILLIVALACPTIWAQECNECNTATGFACFSQTQYMPCDASGVVDIAALATCSAGLFCVSAGNAIVASPCTLTGPPSCLTLPVPIKTTTTTSTTSTTTTTTTTPSTTTTTTPSTTTTTTTAKPFNATTFCLTSPVGRFKNPSVTTCNTYVRCYIFNGSVLGQILTCPGTTRFNPTTQFCDPAFTC